MSKTSALRAVKARQVKTDKRRQSRAGLFPWETLTISPREAAHLASRMERKVRNEDKRAQS